MDHTLSMHEKRATWNLDSSYCFCLCYPANIDTFFFFFPKFPCVLPPGSRRSSRHLPRIRLAGPLKISHWMRGSPWMALQRGAGQEGCARALAPREPRGTEGGESTREGFAHSRRLFTEGFEGPLTWGAFQSLTVSECTSFFWYQEKGMGLL